MTTASPRFDHVVRHNVLLGLFTQALITLPYLSFFPSWVGAFALGLIALRFVLFKHERPGLPRWLKLSLAVAGLAMIGVTFGRIVGREAGTALLLVTLALKLFEWHSPRDFFSWTFANLFLVGITFLNSQTIPMVAHLLATVLLLITLIARGSRWPLRDTPLIADVLSALKVLATALPIALVFFLLFPRLPGPLWAIPENRRIGTTGVSDRMQPGAISELLQSDAVAFRANFDAPIPRSADLYWRGPVLWDFDGATWANASAAFPRTDQDRTSVGTPIHYTIILEAHPKPWLYALDVPFDVDNRHAYQTRDGQVHSRHPMNQRIQYRGISYLDSRTLPELAYLERRRALAVPADRHPKARALAARWQREHQHPLDIIEAALRYFHEQPFRYTLRPAALGVDPIDSFLFRTREGFCEHYASTFTVLMRLAGLPARVVTGYQGGEYNRTEDYLIVRQADAHAWSEVWLEGYGWHRVDPTGAVAPERVESGIAAALPDSDGLPILVRQDIGWLRDLRLQVDALNHRWNRWVIGYDHERQQAFLRRLGLENWYQIGIALSTAFLLLLLLVTAAILWPKERYERTHRAWYYRLLAHCQRRGIAVTASQTPAQVAATVARARPDLADLVQRFMGQFEAYEYGADDGPVKIAALKADYRRLRRQLRRRPRAPE